MDIIDLLLTSFDETELLDINSNGVVMNRKYVYFQVKGAEVEIYFTHYRGNWISASSANSTIWGHGGPLTVEHCTHFNTLGEAIVCELDYNVGRFERESKSSSSCASTFSKTSDKKMASLLSKYREQMLNLTIEEFDKRAVIDINRRGQYTLNIKE